MTDTETAPDTVSEDVLINRGVGRKRSDLESDPAVKPVWDEFVELVAKHQASVAEEERLKNERNAMIRLLKDEHSASFTAMSEIVGTSTSFVEYAYERAAGKTAKQIREEKRASAALKQKMRDEDPDYKPSSKKDYLPGEKEFRAQQREALKAFLAEQAAKVGDATSEATTEASYGDDDV